jgi:hypothetical protein
MYNIEEKNIDNIFMTNKLTESAIEFFAIELLKKHGYQYLYGPDIAPASETPEHNKPKSGNPPERLN